MKFMKFRRLYFAISLALILPSLFSLIKWGLVPGVDFAGGTVIEFGVESGDGQKILETANNLEGEWNIGWDEENQTLRLEGEAIDRNKFESLRDELAASTQAELTELQFATVGPKLGRELVRKTMLAVFLAAVGILAYVGWQFKDWRFGISAVLAMFHDTVILLGVFSLLGHYAGVEVDVLFVTAVLTTLSFSVHDTVVVFDRIRESQRQFTHQKLEVLADKAIAETIVRSLNNSLTIVFMLVALLLLGGASIKWFVVALLVGTLAGTYSSTFTAVPLLVVWENWLEKRKK